jgi:DNA-binding CsgD family transcriptional regulator/tetratricopeptide (TPR) repeat protein
MMTRGGGAVVGRGRELDVILAAADRAAGGSAGTVLIEGPSGMGATRLIDEALARLSATPSGGPAPVILRGDGLPTWRGQPYAPFRVVLECLLAARGATGATAVLGAGAELLLPLVPEAASRFGLPATSLAARERLSDRILEAFRGVVRSLSADAPVVVVIEDLHVLDAASRALVAFLARTLGERPVLLVASYQPEAVGRGHPLRGTLEAIRSGPRPPDRIELAPLDRAALRALVADHEGEAPSAPALLLVAERSGGSPLVAEEVLAARRELSGASLGLPLEQLVVARAAQRSPECRRVLRLLSIAAGPLTPDELAAVAAAYDAEVGRPAPRSGGRRSRTTAGGAGDLATGVEEAVATGFVEASPGGDPGSSSGARGRCRLPSARPQLRVRHELLAAALAADLLPGPRRMIHAAVARSLETAQPTEACRHFHRAHEPVAELRCALDAASAAEAAGAAADALANLELAIELAGAPVVAGVFTASDEHRLLLRAAGAAAASGDAGRAEAFVESAMARLPDPTDRPALAELVERLGSAKLAGGDPQGAIAAFGRALELLPADRTVDRTRVLARLAHVRMLDGAFAEAETLARRAVETAAGTDDAAGRAWEGHATCTLGVIDGLAGRTDAAIARLETALDVASALGRVDDAFRARANMTTMLDLQGRREEAVAVALRGVAAAEADGLEVVHGNLLRGNAADFLVSLGRWAEARHLAERALDWAPSGIPFVNAALGLAIVETETNAGDDAARLLGRMLLELETVPDVQFAVPVYQAAASLALWRGDLVDAERAIDEAWRRVRASEYWALAARTAAAALAVAEARSRVAHERNDLVQLATIREWADGILDEATRLVDASHADAGSWVRREVEADLATARAYASRLRGADTAAAWSAVAGRWRTLGRPYETARALHREAEAHLAAGAEPGRRRRGRGGARVPLLDAAAIAVDLGAVPLLRALGDLAARARISLPDAATETLAASAARARVELAPPAVQRARPAQADGRQAVAATAASFGLSVRERGVLAEIVAGRTNREIGERLFISEKTVGVHVGRILAKLGVGGRVEAATVALRLGLVDDLLPNATRPGPHGPGLPRNRRRGGAA